MTIEKYILIACAALFSFLMAYLFINGVIRFFLFLTSLVAAIFTWFYVQKQGWVLLSFITSSPNKWMVDVLSYSTALLVLLITLVLTRWFLRLFMGNTRGGGCISSLLSLCTFVLFVWAIILVLNYAGSVYLIRFCHDLAKDSQARVPITSHVRQKIYELPYLKWIPYMDILDDPARTQLACIISYGCTLDEARYNEFYEKHLSKSGINYPTRFLKIFADEGMRKLVAEGDFIGIMENEQLDAFLRRGNLEENKQKILNLKLPFLPPTTSP